MNENSVVPTNNRNIWMRGLFMLLMALACHVSVTVLFIISFIQFVIKLLNDAPNERLVSFGRSLARYIQQIVNFMTFASEEKPFPFNDWPTDD
ncbi:MAG: DUF4389 domain-containing protein [Gallionella sp.]|nr:DUF4389 domain-containing protein [Gallionella sp.]